jgi:hypothetical protein
MIVLSMKLEFGSILFAKAGAARPSGGQPEILIGPAGQAPIQRENDDR